MATQQAVPAAEATQVEQPAQRRGVLDDIVENMDARRQAEQARADQLTTKIWASDPQAYIIALGRDYKLGPAHSMQMIYVDPKTGKPNLYAGARATFLQQAGYSWKPADKNSHTDKVCRLRFYFQGERMLDDGGDPLEVEFTIEEAERAEYASRSRGEKAGAKGNYDKIPKNMLFARCISNFHRWYAPHVIGSTVYDQGEITMDRVIEATEGDRAMRMPQSVADVITEAAVAQ